MRDVEQNAYKASSRSYCTTVRTNIIITAVMALMIGAGVVDIEHCRQCVPGSNIRFLDETCPNFEKFNKPWLQWETNLIPLWVQNNG